MVIWASIVAVLLGAAIVVDQSGIKTAFCGRFDPSRNYLIHYILSGDGDIVPVIREVLRKAEPNPQQHPLPIGKSGSFAILCG